MLQEMCVEALFDGVRAVRCAPPLAVIGVNAMLSKAECNAFKVHSLNTALTVTQIALIQLN